MEELGGRCNGECTRDTSFKLLFAVSDFFSFLLTSPLLCFPLPTSFPCPLAPSSFLLPSPLTSFSCTLSLSFPIISCPTFRFSSLYLYFCSYFQVTIDAEVDRYTYLKYSTDPLMEG
uniref:Uncharacterized protein n=1 Tax=Cacopsylla melanoneura TaxID=428564 RepID=A0A8D8SS01_9HEMI